MVHFDGISGSFGLVMGILARLRLFNRRIHADVIVYIFAHLHTALRTEGNMLGKN